MSLASDQRGSESAAVLVQLSLPMMRNCRMRIVKPSTTPFFMRKYVRTNSFIAKPSAANGMANTARH